MATIDDALRKVPVVLGGETRGLDLLEDQRDEIERIIRKKKKKRELIAAAYEPGATTGSLVELTQTPHSRRKTVKQGNSTIYSSKNSTSVNMKELKTKFENTKDHFEEFDKSFKRQRGGGFMSPARGPVDGEQDLSNAALLKGGGVRLQPGGSIALPSIAKRADSFESARHSYVTQEMEQGTSSRRARE